ncbi:MAG TPA: heterodisulfide reductase-related iron-sulfur binding cluster [Methanomassiliicoccales archaeon]|nr:heterodisulfide reductase-related iron-sulfur binding cluster [Methanomassiliicoccales archaeon]
MPFDNRCIKCESCQRACPVVTIEGLSAFSGPRGLAVDGARFAEDADALRDNLYKCTACYRCGDVCPARLPLPEQILALRRSIFAKDESLGGHARILANIDQHRRSVEPTPKPPIIKPSDAKLLYFPGCIAENRLPAIYEGTVSLLNKSRTAYRVPEKWSCCGAPLEKVGDAERMRLVREENLRHFDGFERLVTSCPGCTTHFIQDYHLEPLHTIELLYEVVGVRKLPALPARRKVKVALHQPCHLNRTVGPHVMDYAAEILQRLPGVKLVEMEEADRCCGGGGGVVAGHPDVALALAKAKVESAARAKADLIVAPCPFCVMNISRAGGLEAVDFTSFLDSHLR